MLFLHFLTAMRPTEFAWTFDYPWILEAALAGHLLGPLLITVLLPSERATGRLLGLVPPLALTVLQAANVLILHQLVWWVFAMGAGLLWAGWALQLRLVRGRPWWALVMAMGNQVGLSFAYVAVIFFIVTRTRLGLHHLLALQFREHIEAMGAARHLILVTVGQAIAYSLGLAALARWWPRCLRLAPPPSSVLLAGMIALGCGWLSFDLLAERQPIEEYLQFRYHLDGIPHPWPRRFRHPALVAALASSPPVRRESVWQQGQFRIPDPPPTLNVVIIRVESWRADLATAMMPKWRAWAARGVWLERHHAQANMSVPSNLSLHCGIFPWRHTEFMAARIPSIWVETLASAGYRLACVMSPEDLMPVPNLPMIIVPRREKEWMTAQDVLDTAWEVWRQPGPVYLDAYLYVTHFNYFYPPAYERFAPVVPDGGVDYAMLLNMDADLLARMINRYRNSLLFLDDLLDGFLRRAEAAGLLERSFVLIIGDHGEAFGENGHFAHGTGPQRIQFHVPALLLGPGLSPRRVTSFTQHLDVIPTLAALLGIEATGLPGRNMLEGGHDHLLTLDFSAPERLVLRRSDRMTLFNLPPDGQLTWVLTTDPEFDLPPRLYDWYRPAGIASLAAAVAEDRAAAQRILQRVAGP
ncbi:MAG: putative hydrolase [Candidatus Ozemobacter sibiricus]|uniref:Putative hydrolase n=1 Tax=Candidatus Ozemobacter sibiricus TaxID=2268124 RepID=A0A367ZSZ5_9BACT|nr:MAG: putative hydrolase [Candidatus Ozemobacter sibiricus]